MRPDINKVLCEKERQGEAGDWAHTRRNHYAEAHRARPGYEDRYREYERLEAMPRHESMRARFGGSIRMFGENLGALKGWVRSLVGKPWDKAYSELCRLCPPNGSNTQRHAHQHLDGYIERFTVVLDDGKVGFNNKYTRKWNSESLYQPIEKSNCDYYVHPVTKLVCVNKRKKSKQISWREAERKRVEGCLRIYPKHVFAKFGGIWYCYNIEASEKAVRRHWDPITASFKNYVTEINPDQLRTPFWDAYGESYGRMKLNYEGNARNKRQMNSRELKKFGLANDQKAA